MTEVEQQILAELKGIREMLEKMSKPQFIVTNTEVSGKDFSKSFLRRANRFAEGGIVKK